MTPNIPLHSINFILSGLGILSDISDLHGLMAAWLAWSMRVTSKVVTRSSMRVTEKVKMTIFCLLKKDGRKYDHNRIHSKSLN